MDELIERCLRGDATLEEQARLTAWRRASAENELTYLRTERLLRLVAEARPFFPDQGAQPPAFEQSGSPAESSTAIEARSSSPPSAGRSRRSRWLRGAAWTAGLAAALALAIGLTRRAPNAAPRAETPTTFRTTAAEVRTVRLHDGTVVRLAPASQLRVDPELGDRQVWLSGRAFVTVASDPNRPFVVRTPIGDAIAIGTRFELRAERDSLRLLVVEGHVRLATPAGGVNVLAGEMTEFADGAVGAVVSVPEPHLLVSWAGNFLAFESTPLAAVAAEIEGRYGIPIKVLDPDLRTRTVTGEFTDVPIQSLLDAICRVVRARCTVGDSVVTITSEPTVVDPE